MCIRDSCIKSTADGRHELEFRDVSFRYPGSENWVLRHVNLKLAAGERLAVVGVNGSGKTTMIKLLCRLYDPVEGLSLIHISYVAAYRSSKNVLASSMLFIKYTATRR